MTGERGDAGVVESRPLPAGRGRDYRLTRAGEEFREVVDRSALGLCLKDPEFEVDLVVNDIRVEGRRELVHALPAWLRLSHYAHVERLPRAG